MDRKRLIEILKRSEAVDAVALNAATMEYDRWGNDIIRSLLDKHAVEEAEVVPILSKAWGVPGVDLSSYRPSSAMAKHLSVEIADTHRAVPLRLDGAFLDVAFEAPTPDAVDAVRVYTKLNIRPHVGGPRSIDRILAQCYGRMNVGGYEVDPRVTSGNFLKSDVVDLIDSDLEMGEASMSIAVDMSGFEDDAEAAKGPVEERDLAVALQRAEQRIQLLEAHVARDEDVLRRLFGFLVDKGLGTREEIVKLLS